jgi:hypothetical protein
LLVEGSSPSTQRGELIRRLACGVIAGLALGARPHVAFLILVYWCFRACSSRSVDATHVLAASLAFLAGVAAWLIPAALATGGPATYLHATIGQFEWRFGRPGVSVLGSSISGEYLLSRASALIGSLGQAFAPMHLTAENVARRVGLALLVIALYVVFAWRSASKEVARPYILASAVYVLMLFILLPVGQLRYFLPLSLIVGWAVSGYLALFVKPVVRAVALAALLAVTVLPSLFLVGGLAKVPPPVAALDWVKSNRPAAILYSDQLRRHAAFYWREGETRSEPKSEADCDQLRRRLGAGRIVLATTPELCGIVGAQIASFKRDARIHDKHHRVTIFEFGE